MSTNISGTLRGLHEHSIGTLRRLQGIVHHGINNKIASENLNDNLNATASDRELTLEASKSARLWFRNGGIKCISAHLVTLYKVRSIENLLEAIDQTRPYTLVKLLIISVKTSTLIQHPGFSRLAAFSYYNDKKRRLMVGNRHRPYLRAIN